MIRNTSGGNKFTKKDLFRKIITFQLDISTGYVQARQILGSYARYMDR